MKPEALVNAAVAKYLTTIAGSPDPSAVAAVIEADQSDLAQLDSLEHGWGARYAYPGPLAAWLAAAEERRKTGLTREVDASVRIVAQAAVALALLARRREQEEARDRRLSVYDHADLLSASLDELKYFALIRWSRDAGCVMDRTARWATLAEVIEVVNASEGQRVAPGSDVFIACTWLLAILDGGPAWAREQVKREWRSYRP